jgi:hypothetical protein
MLKDIKCVEIQLLLKVIYISCSFLLFIKVKHFFVNFVIIVLCLM